MSVIDEEFDGYLESAADWVEKVNRDNGWYDESRTFGEDIALLHSEVSEALDAYRSHGLEDATKTVAVGRGDDGSDLPIPEHLQKPEGVGSELADVLVRLLDTARRYPEINLGWEFRRKMAFNATRGYRHGGKLI